jgi:DNA-binding GntR family transcriptional regulator
VSELTVAIDRSSPVPLYFQVSRQLESAIERGDLLAGTRLENEIAMANRWGLSRPTVRRAVQELVSKGLVVRKRGIGTQVVGPGQVKRQVQLTSLYDDLSLAGQDPTTRVLMHRTEPADLVVATHLNVAEGAEVVYLERLRYARGEPLALMRNWLPCAIGDAVTSEQLEARGLYELMRRIGIHLRIASQRIGARAATTAEARLLGGRKNAPLLTMERTAYDDNGRAVELGNHIYRAESYSFEVMVVER